MPRGYRYYVAALAGVALLLWGIAYGLTQQTIYEEDARNRSADYTRRAADQAQYACFNVVPSEKADCLRNAASEYRLKHRDNRRDYDDLTAQRKSALWTFIMGVAALIGMALSVVGVVLVWTTFRETREANVIARDAQRAWVTLKANPKLVRLTGTDGLYMRVDFIAENTGGSAATHFAFESEIFFLPQTERKMADEMEKQVREWFSDYDTTARSYLLPRDQEISGIWQSYTPPQVEWWDMNMGPKSVHPMLLAAVFYRTVSKPDIVQVGWRSWYLQSINEKGDAVSFLPADKAPFGPKDLCVEPFHGSMVHEEYPAT
jgi:hypothetical protein